MADGGEQHDEAESAAGYWLGSWIQAAKEKSAQTYELIKADLGEFRNVCSTDATAAVASTAHRLQDSIQSSSETSGAEMVKQGFSHILGGITKALTVPPDDDEDDDIMRVTSTGNLEMFDKAKARLYELQKSPQTFCTEPDGPADKFLEWKSSFDLEARKGEISDLLVSVNEMRGIYTKLVPGAVSHSDFWERYFYKVHQLEENEKRKADLKMRADKLTTDGAQSWEDDWESEDQTTSSSATSMSKASPLSASSVADINPTMVTKQDNNTTHTPTASNTIPDVVNDVTTSALSGNTIHPVSSTADKTFSKMADKSSDVPVEAVPVTVAEPSPEKVDPALIDGEAMNKQVDIQSQHAASTASIPEMTTIDATTTATTTVTDTSEQVTSKLEDTHITSNLTAVQLASNAEDARTSEKVDDPSPNPDDILVKEKGGYVMLGSERPTPTSSVGSGSAKYSAGTDDDWEKELFGGDDLKAVQELAQKISEGKADTEVDWEDWE